MLASPRRVRSKNSARSSLRASRRLSKSVSRVWDDFDGEWKEYLIADQTETHITLRDLESNQEVSHELSFFDVLPCNDKVLSDMTGLDYLHEPGVLHNLKQRSVSGMPYTLMGSLLVSVNPFEWLTQEPKTRYIDKPLDSQSPHPFALAGELHNHRH